MWRLARNRLLLIGATAAAGALIATPTVIGLSGNTSFTRDIHVPVPSGAHHVEASDLTPSPSAAHATQSRPEHRGGGVEDGPGRDVASSGTTDDHGGLRTSNSGSGRGPSGSDDDRGGGGDRFGRFSGGGG